MLPKEKKIYSACFFLQYMPSLNQIVKRITFDKSKHASNRLTEEKKNNVFFYINSFGKIMFIENTESNIQQHLHLYG